jgi:hypothetical protein
MADALRIGRPTWLDFVPAGLWAGVILALSTRSEAFFEPVARVPHGAGLRIAMEILVHIVQFSVFFFLAQWALSRRSLSAWSAQALALSGVIALSLLNESVQAYTPTRMFDVFDITVDITAGMGMALGTRVAHLARRSEWTPGR